MKKGNGLVELFPSVIAAVIGWALLTMLNFLPLWLECPLVKTLKVSDGYDVNIMYEYTFEAGLFSKRLAENGNLSAGAKLIYNDKSAYYTINDVTCEIDLKKMERRDLKGTAKAEPHFCDNHVYISTAYLDEISVGKLGDGSPQSFEENWYDHIMSFNTVQYPLYTLLKKSETEELTTIEMAKLVGFTIHGELVGWDGENAWFRFDDASKNRIIFQKYNDNGVANVVAGSCSSPGIAMVTGNIAIYRDGKLLKTLNLETYEEKTVNSSENAVVYFNHISMEGRRILVWIGTDGIHTLDLDTGKTNFAEGDWYSDYCGLYICKNHIFALRNDRGFYKWTYTL